MQFYFIRHGQSQNNWLYASTGSWQGRSQDPDLTPLGRQQADRLAQFLRQPGPVSVTQGTSFDPKNIAGFGITHLYCSLMVRAVRTGAAVARALDLPLVAWEDVHETGGIHSKDVETGEHIGRPGRNRAYFESNYPDLVLPDTLGDEGWWNRPFEQPEQRLSRARRFLAELVERHGYPDHRVAIISHGGFFGLLMRVLFQVPEESQIWFAMSNTGITRLDFEEDHIWVQYMNRTDFLPREMVT